MQVTSEFPIVVPTRNPDGFNPPHDPHFNVAPAGSPTEPLVMMWPGGRHTALHEALNLPAAEALHAALGKAIEAARASQKPGCNSKATV